MSLIRFTFASCLLIISTPLLALQCKLIPHTSTQQCTSGAKSTLYGFTNMPYALCSKALCTMKRASSSKASCACVLYKQKGWTSLSLSPTAYAKAKPYYDKNNQLMSVQSNYSLANVSSNTSNKMISCSYAKPRPWADCFGARCVVTGNSTATCSCPVRRNKQFDIGPGNTRKCNTQPLHLWSGILSTGSSSNTQFIHALYTKLYPHAPAAQ